MQSFQANLPHLLVALVVIIAAVVLAVTHEITGGEAVAMISTAGGFSLGTAGAQASFTAAGAARAAIFKSGSGTVQTQATLHPAVGEQ